MSTLIFPCGCEFPVDDGRDERIMRSQIDELPLGIKLDPYNIPHNCATTWQLLGEGKTKGMFQLEGHLGQTWAGKIKPENIEELGALVSLIRPGCLRVVSGDPPKNMTQRYKDRKLGLEDVEYFDTPELQAILDKTYGILCFQEQSMQIAVSLAGFNEQEADILRKSISKKDAATMSKVQGKFIEGCKTTAIISKEKADEIFGWIRESQKYSFNKSIVPTTTVITDTNNIKTIDKLEIGEKIKCPGNNKDIFSTVLNKFEHGVQEVYEIELGGSKIQCTMQHKFLCDDNVIRPLYEIIFNDYYIVCITYPERIINIQSVGPKRTVDIEVDNDSHLFYGNGIATSNSHAISYAEGSYWTAYCKAHFPLQFFCSYLRGANWKQDKYEEIATLVNDAKLFNIKVNPPDLRDIQTNFYIKNQELYFGLLEVKQVGESSIVKIQHALKEVQLTLDRQIDNWSWLDYLIFFSDKISSSINKSLILTGATDFFGESRTLMSYHMDCWTQLTKKEKAWIQTKQYESTNNARWTTLHDALCDCAHKKADGGGCHTVRRIQVMQSVGNILRNPPHSLSDSFHFMAWNEEKLLGLPLTCNMVDDCDGAIQANTTCKELLDGKDGYIILAVTINRIKEIHTKKAKKKMAFLTVSDNTYALDSIVCFPDDWKEFKDLLTVSNTVLLHGETSKKGSFIIKQVWQI